MKLPYMPFFVGDYFQDTYTLSTLEHGTYLLLLLTYWKNQGPLPNDDKRLAEVTRMTVARWKGVRPKMEEFFNVSDDFWSHGRVDRELDIARSKSKKAAESAAGRWGNRDANA